MVVIAKFMYAYFTDELINISFNQNHNNGDNLQWPFEFHSNELQSDLEIM